MLYLDVQDLRGDPWNDVLGVGTEVRNLLSHDGRFEDEPAVCIPSEKSIV